METPSSTDRLLKLSPPPEGVEPDWWAYDLKLDAARREEHEENIQALREHRLWLIEKKRTARIAESED